MKIERYIGSRLQTNAYYLPEARLLIDAPDGSAAHAESSHWAIDDLLLTHGHFDHLWDAAPLARTKGCRVFCHQADQVMLENPEIWRAFGVPSGIEPLKATRFLADGEELDLGPFRLRCLHVPGHCPGSLCFYEEREGIVFGGDVLFSGGIGRCDFPGCSEELLLSGIRAKLLNLPDSVCVMPGHGPATTIGAERRGNPFFRASMA